MMKMNIDICRDGRIRFPYRGVRKKDVIDDAEKVARILCISKCSITIILVDNDIIRMINKKFRKKNKPTDVISFAERDLPFPNVCTIQHLGDVYISLEKAWEQYRQYSRSFREEVRRLLVHGILHLLGYDHEKSAREAKKMKKKEDEVLGKIS